MTMPKGLTPEQQEEWKKQKRQRASEWQRQNPERAKRRKRDWYLNNRDLCLERAKAQKEKSRKPGPPKEVLTPEQRKERHKQYMRDYYAANKDKIIDRWLVAKREYMKDPMYRVKEALRSRINSAINRKGYSKKTKTFQILGCSFEDFVQYIENQFVNGMTWENQGDWHIDHMVPVSIARNEEELIKLNHYTNLRPLYAKDNFEKNDKMLEEYIPLRIKLLGW